MAVPPVTAPPRVLGGGALITRTRKMLLLFHLWRTGRYKPKPRHRGNAPPPKHWAPDFIVIGAGKSGTTSLYHHLDAHPQICMSRIKEPNYYSFGQDHPSWHNLRDMPWVCDAVRHPDEYRALFCLQKPAQICGEASGTYLFHPMAARNIRENAPAVRLIAILRDPVERAYSGFRMHQRRGDEKRSFKDAILAELGGESGYFTGSYIAKGMYYSQLSRYFSLFPRENIKVFKFQELTESPAKMLHECYAFLGVDPDWKPVDLKAHNQAPVPDAVPPDLRRELLPHFREDILSLEKLVNQEFSEWLA